MKYETLSRLQNRRKRVARVRLRRNKQIIKNTKNAFCDQSVYLIRHGQTSAYKIGIGNPRRRLHSLQTGNPIPLSLIKHIVSEKYCEYEVLLHKKYSKLRINGEWFLIPQAIVTQVLLDFDKLEQGIDDIGILRYDLDLASEIIENIACGVIPCI